MPWPTKKLGTMEKAWLLRWNFYAVDESEQLKRFGINEKIVDIINTRKTFEQVMDITKDVYRRTQLSFVEKIFLENYSKGKERKKEFFQRTPISTNYTTDLYRDYMLSFRENGMDHPITNKLFSQWRKYPVHITIGVNPALDARLVFNLTIHQNKDGKEIVEWDESLVNGTCKKEKYAN